MELDSSARPGISLSVSGPPGGGPSPAQMDTPFQSMVSNAFRPDHHSICRQCSIVYTQTAMDDCLLNCADSSEARHCWQSVRGGLRASLRCVVQANRREPASTSRPPPPKLDVPSRPYLSLSMPGPEIDSLYPLARHRSAARSAARPVSSRRS